MAVPGDAGRRCNSHFLSHFASDFDSLDSLECELFLEDLKLAPFDGVTPACSYSPLVMTMVKVMVLAKG